MIFITAVPAQYYAGTTQGSGPGVLRSAAYYAPSLTEAARVAKKHSSSVFSPLGELANANGDK